MADLPLSAGEERFIEHGPAEMYNKTKWVLQIRFVAVCANLIRARLRAGAEYSHVLRMRADVVLSSMPDLRALPRGVVFCAYRAKDVNFGGFNDKVWLGPVKEMLAIFDYYHYALDESMWTWLRALHGAASFSRSALRFWWAPHSHLFGENLLHVYLLAQGVQVRAHPRLFYDKPQGGEAGSPAPRASRTGIFTARVDNTGFSNAWPYDPFLHAPLEHLLHEDQARLGRPLVALELGTFSLLLRREYSGVAQMHREL